MKKLINKLLEAGLTQTEISGHLGCSQPTISEILSGKNKNPSFKFGMGLVRLCKERGIECPLPEFSGK